MWYDPSRPALNEIAQDIETGSPRATVPSAITQRERTMSIVNGGELNEVELAATCPGPPTGVRVGTDIYVHSLSTEERTAGTAPIYKKMSQMVSKGSSRFSRYIEHGKDLEQSTRARSPTAVMVPSQFLGRLRLCQSVQHSPGRRQEKVRGG